MKLTIFLITIYTLILELGMIGFFYTKEFFLGIAILIPVVPITIMLALNAYQNWRRG